MIFSATTTRIRRGLLPWGVASVLLSAGLMTGCRIVQTAAEIPGQTVRAVTPGAKERAIDPTDIQQKLLRFSDEFCIQMIAGINKLQSGTNALGLAETLDWKISVVSESCAIASGQNALANLLDMTVFVTAVRISLEEHWHPKIFGDSVQSMLDAARSSETNIWALAGSVLDSKQQEELRQAIAAWREEHPDPEKLIGLRAVGFTTELSRSRKSEAETPGSLFGLFGLDPLSGLDPATREIALTRMLAERALFVGQWMPTLVRWQTERMLLSAMTMPEIQQLVTNSTQIASSVDRFSLVVGELPDKVKAEREALLKEIKEQERQLTTLLTETRQTLNAGGQMADSLNTTLTTFDALMQRFGVGQTNAAAEVNTNSIPFNILDYAQTAVRLEAAARQLTELVQSVDRTIGSTNLVKLSNEAAPVIESAQSAGKEVVDYAFRKIVWLIVIGCACVSLSVWLARLTRAGTANWKGEAKR